MGLSALLHFIMTSKCVSAHSYSIADILLPYTRYRPYICPISHITALQLSAIRESGSKGTQFISNRIWVPSFFTCPTQGPVLMAAVHQGSTTQLPGGKLI